MSLVITLAQGQRLRVNGAEMRVVNGRSRIAMLTQDRFIFGKQYPQDDAASLAERFHRAVCRAYSGHVAPGAADFSQRSADYEVAARLAPSVGGDHVLRLLIEGEGWAAVNAARELLADAS